MVVKTSMFCCNPKSWIKQKDILHCILLVFKDLQISHYQNKYLKRATFQVHWVVDVDYSVRNDVDNAIDNA